MGRDKTTEKEKTFTEIYTAYFPRLIRFSSFYILSEDNAENIVQDIFAYLWEHPEIQESLHNPDAFLFTMVKNRCIDFLRRQISETTKRKTIEEVDGREYQLKLYTLQLVDDNKLDLQRAETALREALDKLPPRCREIFVLHRMEGLKHREIAERLNISTATVESQMNIALRKLKTELKDYLPILLFFLKF